jgi:hypothetical protein
MPILENPRHERFAQLRANGKTGSDSYRAIAGKDARYADVRADQLMKMPGVPGDRNYGRDEPVNVIAIRQKKKVSQARGDKRQARRAR